MNLLFEEWKKKKESVFFQNQKFLSKLTKHKGKALDRFADETHEKVFAKINCLECAGCCTSIPPMINKTDSARIAKYLGISQSDFEKKFLKSDEDNDTVINYTPCPFLEKDNSCSIYDVRPKACREYPHTDKLTFSSNLSYHAVNALYCPAVFHILENLKKNIPV